MGITFVSPETVTLPLSDGESITIRKRLTHGESDEMMARILPNLAPGERISVESKGVRTAKVLAYLLTWSSSVPMSPTLPEADRIATINALDPDSFDEIEQAIDHHIAAMEQERAEKKRVRGIAIASVPISRSVA